MKNPINTIVSWKDKAAEKYPFIKFALKLQDTFNKDDGGNKVGYITYYMFLSLLPLLIASLTIFDMVFSRNEALRKRIIESTLTTIPVIGPTLKSDLSFVKGRGITLVVTLVLLLWAARGGALAMQHALSVILNRQKLERSFISQQWRAYASMGVIIFGLGIPTFVNSVIPSFIGVRILALVLGAGWNMGLIFLVFTILTSNEHAKGYGPIVGGVAITIVQFLAVLIMDHTLDNARPLYGTLAVVLALLAWIALQVRVLLYAAEINVVQHGKS